NRPRLFRDDKGYVLYPQIGDRLDLICPPLDTARSTPEYEFYKLYLVSSREQADRCEVMGAPNIVLTCDEPTRERRFTIKFQEFSPNLWGHEFKSLHDYYIIGERSGCVLSHPAGCGWCSVAGEWGILHPGLSSFLFLSPLFQKPCCGLNADTQVTFLPHLTALTEYFLLLTGVLK
uniref:Ephrin RBD domain-containing protein n=1 Tax=Xiphophorus couchianus TaxID=32473 RepID=A0A3B5LBW3_9TELE